MPERENDSSLSEDFNAIHDAIYFRCGGNNAHTIKIAIVLVEGLEIFGPVDVLEASDSIWGTREQWLSMCTTFRALKEWPFCVPSEEGGTASGCKIPTSVVSRSVAWSWWKI